MKLLGSTKNKITQNENIENVPHLEINEVTLLQCNLVNNDYQQDSRVCKHLFLINHLVNYYIFHPRILYLLKLNSEFLYIKVWFSEQNSDPSEIEDKINITLVIN